MNLYADPKEKKELLKKYPLEKFPNLTGIPNAMKHQYENFSGFSFDDVRVHYNSDNPTNLKALAYTQGSHIHIKSGQEKHLGHELSHVIQQKKGIVKPTMHLDGVPINDDPSLEIEADNLLPILNKDYNCFNHEANKVNVVQRVGERAAIRSTIKSSPYEENQYEESKGEDKNIFGVRRGNVQSSIIMTHGKSVTITKEIRNCIQKLYKDFMDYFFLPNLSSEYESLIKGELSLIAGAGNCSEFSCITFSHLVSNTKNQWVYRCKLVSTDNKVFDHNFTITSKIELEKGMMPVGVDLDKMTVVDGWFDYSISTLRQFCDSENPYSDLITGSLEPSKNIKIISKLKAGTENSLNKEQKAFIEEWYDDYFPKEKLSLSPGELNKLLDDDNIFGDEKPTLRVICDKRPLEEQINDLDHENINIIIDLIKNNHYQIVANKLNEMDKALFTHAMSYLRKNALEQSIQTSNFMDLLSNQLIDKIEDEIVAILFFYYKNTNNDRKGDYIRYLWGKGIAPKTSRIRQILVLNTSWTQEFIKRLPASGWFTFTQQHCNNIINNK